MPGEKLETNCAICGEEIILQNDSWEHVILEPIGGRLKVRGFACISCNNNAGRT